MDSSTITHADIAQAVDDLIAMGRALPVQREALIAHGDRDLFGFARRVRNLVYGGSQTLSARETDREVDCYLALARAQRPDAASTDPEVDRYLALAQRVREDRAAGSTLPSEDTEREVARLFSDYAHVVCDCAPARRDWP